MAKGRTNQPLVYFVADEFMYHDVIKKRISEGHMVIPWRDVMSGVVFEVKPDLILHPASHQWNDMMWDFEPAAVAAARKRKREAQ